jgi:hypothetical protein
MSDWVHIVLPIATLVLGSLLTMAGQALRDRRMEERDRRARREGFLASNFEMHRSAMLKMQELVRDFYDAFYKEKQRRINDGFYQYMEAGPLRGIREKMGHSVTLSEQMTNAIVDASSDAERKELINSFTKDLKAATKEAERVRDEIDKMGTVMASLYPFWEEYVRFAGKLRICMYRSGSNSVVYFSEALIDAIYKWNEYYGSDGSQDELTDQLRTARYELNRALANALKFGPYDKYGSQKEG